MQIPLIIFFCLKWIYGLGWLLANSGNTAEKNVHLGPGIDFFVDDMLLSVNGNNLVGLELSEVLKLICPLGSVCFLFCLRCDAL